MSKYSIEGTHEIIKVTKLYSDGKTQVPKEIIELLNLQKGSKIVWIQNGDVITVSSSKI